MNTRKTVVLSVLLALGASAFSQSTNEYPSPNPAPGYVTNSNGTLTPAWFVLGPNHRVLAVIVNSGATGTISGNKQLPANHFVTDPRALASRANYLQFGHAKIGYPIRNPFEFMLNMWATESLLSANSMETDKTP